MSDRPNPITAGLANEDWRLEIVPKWKQKREPTYEPCARCGGAGGHKPGFGYIDDPREDPNYDSCTGRIRCSACYGSGKKLTNCGFTMAPPKLPDDFIAHMRVAFDEYCRIKEEAANNLQTILNKY